MDWLKLISDAIGDIGSFISAGSADSNQQNVNNALMGAAASGAFDATSNSSSHQVGSSYDPGKIKQGLGESMKYLTQAQKLYQPFAQFAVNALPQQKQAYDQQMSLLDTLAKFVSKPDYLNSTQQSGPSWQVNVPFPKR